jgi:hypothetical protein
MLYQNIQDYRRLFYGLFSFKFLVVIFKLSYVFQTTSN